MHRGRGVRPQTRGRGVQRAQGATASAYHHITDEAGPSDRERSLSPLRHSPSPSQRTDNVGRTLREGNTTDLSYLDSIFSGVEDIHGGVYEGERRERIELERIEEEEEEELSLRPRSRRSSEEEFV